MFGLGSKNKIAGQAIARAMEELAAEGRAEPDAGHTPEEKASINGAFGLVKIHLSMIDEQLVSQFEAQRKILEALFRKDEPDASDASIQASCIFAFRAGLLGHGLIDNLMKPAALIHILGLRTRIEHPEWAEGQLMRICEDATSANNDWIERS